MSWIELLQNNKFLRDLYPPAGPSLEGVEIHEVSLHRDGPTFRVRFNLAVFPAKPPLKWVSAGFNTAQVTLMGVGVNSHSANGWASNVKGSIEIERGSAGVLLRCRAAAVRVDVELEFLYVHRVSAYLQEAR